MTQENLKRCPRCEQSFPATADFFYRTKRSPSGLCADCKSCDSKRRDKHRKENPEKERERGKLYNATKRVVRERSPEQQTRNRERAKEYSRTLRSNNPEKVAENKRGYYKKHPEQRRAKAARWAARKRGLPRAFTSKDWINCLEYFNYCCAVCGCQLRDLFGDVVPHADHWIPLSYSGADNPGTVPTNMICLCRFCNLSKHDTPPKQWLTEKHGTKKAMQILKRVETYFASVNTQEEKAA